MGFPRRILSRMEADLSKAKTRNRCPREGFSASVEVVERGFAFNPKSMRKTARAKRVVWTVPGAAADPPGSAAERFGPPRCSCVSSVVLERPEGEE